MPSPPLPPFLRTYPFALPTSHSLAHLLDLYSKLRSAHQALAHHIETLSRHIDSLPPTLPLTRKSLCSLLELVRTTLLSCQSATRFALRNAVFSSFYQLRLYKKSIATLHKLSHSPLFPNLPNLLFFFPALVNANVPSRSLDRFLSRTISSNACHTGAISRMSPFPAIPILVSAPPHPSPSPSSPHLHLPLPAIDISILPNSLISVYVRISCNYFTLLIENTGRIPIAIHQLYIPPSYSTRTQILLPAPSRWRRLFGLVPTVIVKCPRSKPSPIWATLYITSF